MCHPGSSAVSHYIASQRLGWRLQQAGHLLRFVHRNGDWLWIGTHFVTRAERILWSGGVIWQMPNRKRKKVVVEMGVSWVEMARVK
jgi:hypothetical protein